MEEDDNLIPTGVPILDDKMDGGLKLGELAVFIAPTGRGKTMWLCQIAAMGMLLGDTDVAYYTLEVDQDEIFLRTMASASAIPINDLRLYAAGGNDYENLGKRHKAKDAIENFHTRVRRMGVAGRDIYIRDVAVRGANLNTIFSDFERIKRDGATPKLMIIDYADRLRPRGRYDRLYEGQEEIYQELALLAKEYNIAIWTAAQADRKGLRTKRLTLDYVKGAFSKTFEATYVVAAGQANAKAKEQDEEFYFLMAKMRRSGNKSPAFYVKHALAYSRFYGQERPYGEDEDDIGEEYGSPLSYVRENDYLEGEDGEDDE